MIEDIVAKGLSPLIRSDFSDDDAWRHLVKMAKTPSPEGFLPYFNFVENSDQTPVTDAVLKALKDGNRISVVFIADARSMSPEDPAAECVDLYSKQSVRCIPSQFWSVENNLSISNMGIEEFIAAADENGIYRGL